MSGVQQLQLDHEQLQKSYPVVLLNPFPGSHPERLCLRIPTVALDHYENIFLAYWKFIHFLREF